MFEIATFFLFCAIFGGITVGTTAQDTPVDPNCEKPWKVTVSSDLLVSWSGVNRTGDVRGDFRAIDPPVGVKCNRKLNIQTHFYDYELSLPPSFKPCRGTQYNVTVTLICDKVIDDYNFEVNVAPDDLTAVENVTEVVVTDERIEIKWDSLQIHGRPDISYTVQWHALDATASAKDSAVVSSYIITNLNPYTEYSIKVRAHSGQETGNWSEVLTVRTKAGVPSKPRNLKTNTDSTIIWIEWEEPTPFRGPILLYTVKWRKYEVNKTEKYTKDNTSSLHYVFRDLIPLTNYFIRVVAWTDAGKGNFTDIRIGKTKRPVAPENLCNTSITSRSIGVSWEEPSLYAGRGLIVAYSVQWTNVETNESRIENTTEVVYKIEDLYPFTNYKVQVRAWTENGFGDWTQPITLQTAIGVPGPPENLRNSSITRRSIEVVWDEPSLYAGRRLITAYYVEWIHVDTNEIRWANTKKLSYKIKDLYPFTNYSVRVRAWTESGFGEWTQSVILLTEIGIPDPPEMLHETATTIKTIDIAWNEPSLYSGRGLISIYSVQCGNLDTRERRSDNTTELAFKIVNLQPFANYSIRVRAWTEYGSGAWTNPLIIRTKIGVPWPPEKLKAGKVTDSSVELTWEVQKEYKTLVTRHTVKWERKDFPQEKTEDTVNSEYVLQNLDPVTSYDICVRSWTVDGAGNWTDPILVTTSIGVPSVPINVTFTDIQQTSMEIVWEEPQPFRGSITSYIVQWGAVDDNHIEKDVSTERSLVLRQLNPFTFYWAQVSASSYAGAGKWSTREEARTAVGTPTAPRNLTEMEATNTTIRVEWKEPRPTNGPIELYIVRWTNVNNEITMNGTTKSLDYVIKNLDPYTNHSIEVCATTEAGSGDWSDSLVIRTDIGVPSEPIGLEMRKATDASMELEWKEPEPTMGIIEYYVLQWNNTITGERKKIKTGGNSAIVRGLDPYTEYSVRVRAATSAGQGNWAEPRIFRTASGVPESPQNLRQLKVTNRTIDLEWENPKPFKGPIIFYTVRWTNINAQQSWFNNTERMLYTIEGLDAYTPYSAAVRAKTDTGYGPWTDAIDVWTAIGIPTVPRALSIINKTAWSIEITWNSPDPSNGPLVNYEIKWGVLGAELHRNLTNETSFETEGLLPYTKYSFQVSAATEVGYGPKSPPLVIPTDVAIPSAPMDVNLTSSTNTSLSVKWEEPQPSNGPILGYSIQWGKSAELMLSNETSSPKYKIIDLDPYTNYTILISARTAAGSGAWTEPLVASTLTSIPKPARLSRVDVESSRTISVQWYTLTPYPGPTNYSLEVFRRPGQCGGSLEDIRETALQGHKGAADEWGFGRTEMVEGLTPYSQYYVRVVLVTTAGGSESSNSTTVRTLPESPGAPTNVRADCVQSSTVAEVRWNPPQRSNGKIIEYIVKYGVENFGYEKTTLAATSQCREHRVHLTGLRPEKKYRIRVQARTEGISKVGEEGHMQNSCVLPAGVPPMGNSENIKAEGSGSFQLVFQWSRDVFSDEMGSLVNYAVLVGQPESVENATSGQSAELLPPWANFSAGVSSFYQATPQEWNPFEKDKSDPLNCEEFRTDDGVEIRIMLKCTVGLKSQCSSEEPYCNGPLSPDTQYGLKIRAFTRGGFSETGPIFAKTGPVSGSSLVGGLIGGFMFLLLVSAFIVGTFILKRKGKLEELRLVVLARFRPPQPTAPTAPTAPYEQVLQLESYPAPRQLTAENFSEHVRIMISDSHLRFSQEFEALKHDSPKFPCAIAEMEENRSKNRWLNIFPYDHSRVKLLPLGDEPESDFINANYIPGHSSLREYIACQGPLKGTVDDMWRMVWEQATTMLVMLTQCVERGKNKCEQYWPTPAGEAKFYGDIQVNMLSESMLSLYIIRVFHMQLGSQTRMVKQMHFTHWPDFGCPESPDDLINFIRAVRDHLPRTRPGPILVHCSAGVGRTGTFIAVDRLSKQLHETSAIDIYGTVMELRHHRVNMVQTEDQYIYIHLCVKQLLEEASESTKNEYDGAIYSNVGMEKDTGV